MIIMFDFSVSHSNLLIVGFFIKRVELGKKLIFDDVH